MKKIKRKMMIRACSILTSIALFTTFSAPAYAEDSIETLEGTTSDLQNELSGLNSELADLSKELDSILKKMDETTSKIEQTKFELSNAKWKEKAQYDSMKTRIKYIYENGSTSFIEMLFSASSMADLLNKADFITAMSEYDKQLLDTFTETKNTVAEKEKELQNEQASLLALKTELAKKEADLTNKISSTSGELAKYSAKLEKAKEQAKAAQEALDKEVKPTPPPTPAPPTEDNSGKEPPENIGANDVELLAALIECEAGSTHYEGMLAVGSVVINRRNHRSYPNTIRGVIYQSGQFSPVKSGKLDKVLKRGIKLSCRQAAYDAISGKNNVGSCLNFRAASTGHSGIIIGGNVFF